MSFQGQNTDYQSRTVGDIAARIPGATAVFREFGVDFCCHGDIALADAVRQRGIDLADLERKLHALEESGSTLAQDVDSTQLIDHIIGRFHDTHRRELPELIDLAKKVESVHKEHLEVPRGLARLLQELRGELESHMKKEELILFPAMKRHAAMGLDAPIAQMRADHLDHGEHLRQMELTTGGFSAPADACRSWQALYAGTAKLRNDLIEHIHLENNLLFPGFQSR